MAITGTGTANVSLTINGELPAVTTADNGKIAVVASGVWSASSASGVLSPTLTNPPVTGNAGNLITKADSSPTGAWIAQTFASVGIDDALSLGTKTWSSSKIGTYVTGLITAVRQVTDPASGASNKVLGWINSTTFGWVDVIGGITRTSSGGWQNITGETWTGTTAPTFATGAWQYRWTNDGGLVRLRVRGRATVAGTALTAVSIPLAGLGIPLAEELAGLVSTDIVVPAFCTIRSTGASITPTQSACGITKTASLAQALVLTFASGSVVHVNATVVYYTA